MVRASVAYGIPHDDIAATIGNGIGKATLHKHFKTELERGRADFVRSAGSRLFEIMNQRENLAAATTAAIFFLKTRGGWSEKQSVELSGPEGGPIQTSGVLAVPGVTDMAAWSKLATGSGAPSIVDDTPDGEAKGE